MPRRVRHGADGVRGRALRRPAHDRRRRRARERGQGGARGAARPRPARPGLHDPRLAPAGARPARGARRAPRRRHLEGGRSPRRPRGGGPAAARSRAAAPARSRLERDSGGGRRASERDAPPAAQHRRARPAHDRGVRAARRLRARRARRCSRWSPQDVLHELEESGLRGRGGAGFSMGKKASFIPKGQMDKYLCCNADESEPGAFKDRLLMQKNPHLLVEGCIIGAIAAGANKGFIFIRGEYETQADILDAAVAEAYDRGYLGERILGSEHLLRPRRPPRPGRLHLRRGDGPARRARGQARQPAAQAALPRQPGPLPGPHAINNVETLCNAPIIIEKGADVVPRSSARATRPAPSSSRCPGNVQRPGQLRGRARHHRARDHLRARRRPARGSRPQVLLPRRLVRAGADQGAPRPALHLRVDGRGGLDARHRLGHRRRRLSAARPARPAARRVLPPRVVRQVRPLPRGHQLDGQDARAARRGRGHAHGPRHPRAGPGQHHRQLPVRARRLDGDARGVDAQALPARVRAAHGGRARAPRPRRRSRRWAPRSSERSAGSGAA